MAKIAGDMWNDLNDTIDDDLGLPFMPMQRARFSQMPLELPATNVAARK